IRTEQQYRELAGKVFTNVDAWVDKKPMRIPYVTVVLECEKKIRTSCRSYLSIRFDGVERFPPRTGANHSMYSFRATAQSETPNGKWRYRNANRSGPKSVNSSALDGRRTWQKSPSALYA